MTSTETTSQVCEDRACEHHREVARLRRNLHDGLGAGLAGIMMRVDVLPRLLNRDPAAAERVLFELRRELAAFMSEFRRVLSDDGPADLDGQSLESAVHAVARRLAGATGDGPTILVEVDGSVTTCGRRTQEAAFWIAKEALTNVVKHAQAGACTVNMWADNGLWLEITDDGIGGVGASARRGVGVPSMHDRAAELGGRCEVVDNDGCGVTVRAYLPG